MLSFLVLIFEILIFGIAESFGVDTEALSVVFIVLLSVCLICELYRNRRLSDVWLIFVCGYLWRLFLLFWDVFCRDIYILPHANSDAEGFFATAVLIASGGSGSYGGMYTKLLALLFSFIGPVRIYAQFLNVLLSMLTLYLVYVILQKCGVCNRTQKTVMWVLCLLPNYAILSCVLLRESVITFFVTVSLYYFVRWTKEHRERFFWVGFAAAMASAVFHSGTVAVAGGYIAIRLIYYVRIGKFRITAKNLIMVFALAFVFIFLFINYSGVFFGKMGNLNNIFSTISQKGTGAGGSTYISYIGSGDTFGAFVVNTFPRMIYYLFSPFPWQWRGLSDIIAFVFSSGFYFICVCSALRCVVRKKTSDRNLVICLSLVCLCTVFVFSWGVSNVGTAIRHRDKVIAIFTVLWAVSSSAVAELRAGGRKR